MNGKKRCGHDEQERQSDIECCPPTHVSEEAEHGGVVARLLEHRR